MYEAQRGIRGNVRDIERELQALKREEQLLVRRIPSAED